jgi:hypothetical protein
VGAVVAQPSAASVVAIAAMPDRYERTHPISAGIDLPLSED